MRVSQGAESYLVETDANGIAAFSLDTATWTVQITKPGYTFTATTLLVSGVETQTYSMTAVSIPAPADPLLATGFVYCYGTDGAIESGVAIHFKMTAGPGTDGYALDSEEFTITSDATGLASHAGFVRGATYRVRRGTEGSPTSIVIPNAGTFDIAEIIGNP